MKEKYILTDVKLNVLGKTLFQIKAIRTFGNVEKGELGGYIEKESNLDHDYNAWVYGNAWVCDNDGIMWIAKIGSRNDVTTFFKNKDNGISVKCGCFKGSIEEFEKAVCKKHVGTKYEKEYLLAIELEKVKILGV